MHDFPESALLTLAEASKGSSSPPELAIHPGTAADSFALRLAAIAQTVSEGTQGRIPVHKGDGLGPPDTPALTINREGQARIHYLSVPEASEALPFLDALLALATDDAARNGVRKLLRPVHAPCELLVFVTPGCPNCPHAVRAATTLAAASPWITASIIDASRFPELTDRFSVRSVPFTVIDRGFSATGVLSLRRLAKLIASRGEHDHEAAAFAAMVDSGRFTDAAQWLLAGRALDHFAQLWGDSTMERRIALMLVVEHALEVRSSALSGLAPMLVEHLDSRDRTTRGDTADLLGKIGDACAIESLERMAVDPDPELREAAAEALVACRRARG